jgi:chromosome segregation and condensation protein ScpB
MQVLTIVAYRQPVSQSGIEGVRGTSNDSAIGTLLQRQLIALDEPPAVHDDACLPQAPRPARPG